MAPYTGWFTQLVAEKYSRFFRVCGYVYWRSPEEDVEGYYDDEYYHRPEYLPTPYMSVYDWVDRVRAPTPGRIKSKNPGNHLEVRAQEGRNCFPE